MKASTASTLCLALDDGFAIRDTPSHGRGLFATRPLPKGQYITRYDGTWVYIGKPLPSSVVKTHMARIPRTDYAIDGFALANSLVTTGTAPNIWGRGANTPLSAGFGAIANASDGRDDLNAVAMYLDDDTPSRFIDLGVGAKGACFLVAKRDIAEGEEIRWHYLVTNAVF